MIQFTEEELDALWHAIQQYVENWEEDVEPPPAALSALEKLGMRKASLAEVKDSCFQLLVRMEVQAFIEEREKQFAAEPVCGLRPKDG